MIDLRSDTITLPDQPMREAIFKAELGDDVFGEDPTVNLLQKRSALLLNGVINAEQIETHIRSDNIHFPISSLISVENTHNNSGGSIFPLEEIIQLNKIARQYNLRMHMDGARLFNAVIATGIPAPEYAKYFDTVSFCFSKGPGAPVGSILCSTEEIIAQARRVRKRLGGGMRQAGIIAAAALYALDNNIERLKEDHQKAGIIAEAIANSRKLTVEPDTVQTNIILFESQSGEAKQIEQEFRDNGILLFALDNKRLRAVTHKDLSLDDAQRTAEIILNTF